MTWLEEMGVHVSVVAGESECLLTSNGFLSAELQRFKRFSYQQNFFYYFLQIYVLFCGSVGHPTTFYFAIASHMSLSMFLLHFSISVKENTDNGWKQDSVFCRPKENAF